MAKWQTQVLTAAAVVVVLLVVVNAVFVTGNRQVQRDIATRNQYIQQSLQLEPIYQALVRALAESAVAQQDAALRDLLASQGITVSVNPSAPAGR